jgi:hypothetical protein
LGLPASAQASSSPPEVQTEPAEAIPGGAKLKGKVNPGGLPTTYYFVYAQDTCDEGCTPSKTATSGPLTGDTKQEVPALGVTLAGGRYWYYLVASNADGTVYGGLVNFTPGAPLPSISRESASHVTSTDATLEARIDPQGDWNGDWYQFQLVKDPSEYASEIVCPKGPFPQVSGCIGTHSETALPIGWVCGSCERMEPWQEAQLDLASAGVTLKPSTTYHYRAIAARAVQTEDTIQWEPPPVYGPDQTFTTPASSAPVIDSVSVSHLTSTDATLEAQINTKGLETSYQFQLRSPECMPPAQCIIIINYPLPSGTLLGSFVDQSVSLDLNSAGVALRPNWEYFYSIVAKSAAGTTEAQSQTFTTPEDGVQPLNTTGPPTTTNGNNQLEPSGTTSTGSPGVTPAGSPLGKTTAPVAPTKSRVLAKALKACAKKPKSKRAACRKQAHKQYRAEIKYGIKTVKDKK